MDCFLEGSGGVPDDPFGLLSARLSHDSMWPHNTHVRVSTVPVTTKSPAPGEADRGQVWPESQGSQRAPGTLRL